MIDSFLQKWLSSELRSKFVALVVTAFALLYHTFILIVFYHLNIYFMVFFNIGSVLFFATSFFLIAKDKGIVIPFALAIVEVVTHQILAIWFTGAESSFQYLILIIGLLPFLLMGKKIKFQLPAGALLTLLYIVIAVLSLYITPHSPISYTWVLILKSINISVSVMVIFLLILIFSYITELTEDLLEHKVITQANALQTQNTKIIEIQNNTIISLSNLVENRDSDTGHHIMRTREYVKLLAEKAQKAGLYSDTLTDHFRELLAKSAPMHDIGKIVVPDSILKKNGKLTDEEFYQIKRHSLEGGKIIRDVLGNSGDEEYITVATEIAEGHHEKWDGTGYPKGIKGEEIPLSARIMALADVFDALVSPRCYKDPFPIDKAIEIIKESSGKHFDPQLAEVFVNHRSELEMISETYKD